ncbi:glycosyltransferase [Flavobacterium sp. I-SCBP12n]|uniref:Glycosyltransferase n=1 Tax=Flavobacterium pygoscelis TaxID=2893176 RepID=A0A9X2BL76_9FLAO|nr:glycosyltransferase [Flavobacterium pygoscelis]MCK8141458.1 glycosyltransferase [Flavobacterium pygoscelis]
MKNNIIPLFSIVIPTYNRTSDLARCLDSLVSQTYKNFEVIVCDNGSSDNTKDVVMGYADKLNLNYIHIIENSGGPAYPRNLGLKEALGDWVCFLDSDDWYTDNRLEYIADLDLNNFDFLYHDLNIIKNNDPYKIMISRALSLEDTYYDFVTNVNSIPTSSTCIRRELLKKTNGFKEAKDISGLEDFDFWLKLAKLNARFIYVPVVLGYYAVGNDNFTYHDDRQINRYKALYGSYIESEPDIRKKEKIRAVLNYHIACIAIKCKKFNKANRLLVSVFYKGTATLKKKAFIRFLIGTAFFLKIIK